ncbi:MAG: transporter substrate-binding domain-containing protein [Longicatena sp.]
MHKNKVIKLPIFVILSMLLLAVFFYNAPLKAEEEQVLRVAYPIQKGLTTKDENGKYEGYSYEYLQEIAQYTGWKYEFVEVDGDINQQLTTLLEMFKKGDIDIFTGLRYSDALAKDYTYASDPNAYAYSVLAVPRDDNNLDQNNLVKKNNVRIAMLEKATMQNGKLETFAQTHGLTYSKVYCTSEAEQMEKIKNKEADALLSIDVSIPSDYRIIAKFSPTPSFIALSNNKKDLVQELNNTIHKINKASPTFMNDLYSKYFDNQMNSLILTNEEREFIKENPTLKVLVHDGFAPIEYVEDGKPAGISVDILEDIAKKTNWKIKYTIAKDETEYQKLLSKHDVILSVPYDYEEANNLNIYLSKAYLESARAMAVYKDNAIHNKELKSAGIVKGEKATNSHVKEFQTLEECLKSVNSKKIDYYLGNAITISYYQNKYNLNDINIVPQKVSQNYKYSFGVNKQTNTIVRDILSKGIYQYNNEELERFIYQNVNVEKEFSIVHYVEEHMGIAFLLVFLISGTIIIFIYQNSRKQLKLKKQIELENQRYKMLADMSGECIFEYSYDKDQFMIPDKCAKMLQIDKIVNSFTQDVMNHKQNFGMLRKRLCDMILIMEDSARELYVIDNHSEGCWYEISCKIVLDQGKPVQVIGKIVNINDKKTEKELLVKRSQLDALTNLYNSITFKNRIETMSLVKNQPVAMFIIDLDFFKQVNDIYGHYVGDQVLIDTAKTLLRVFGEDGIIARIGGDEFAVYIHDASAPNKLEALCARFLEEIGTIYIMQDKEMKLTASIGGIITTKKEIFKELYQQADEVMYQVKKSGKSNFKLTLLDE